MKAWTLFFVLFLFASCGTGRGMQGIKCMKNKPRKTKKYRVKKMKRVYPRVYSVSSGGGNQSKETPEDTLPNESTDSTVVISANVPKTDTLSNNQQTASIPPVKEEPSKVMQTASTTPPIDTENVERISKQNAIPPITEKVPREEQQKKETPATEHFSLKTETETAEEIRIKTIANPVSVKENELEITTESPEIILSFREQQINITKGYSFNENIPFVINRDRLLNQDEAYQQIKDLSDLLKENPQVHVTIIANTATDEPHPSHQYGKDEKTLSNMFEKEEKDTEEDDKIYTLKDLMIARGKKIQELLVENGVNPEQLSYQMGSHNMWKYQRLVTFVLNEEE